MLQIDCYYSSTVMTESNFSDFSACHSSVVYPGKSFFFFLNALKVSTHAKLCCCQAAVCHPRPKSTFCFKLSQEFPRLYSVTKLKVDKSVLRGRIVVGLVSIIS